MLCRFTHLCGCSHVFTFFWHLLYSIRHRLFFVCFRRTISTEQGAWLTTDDATLPKSNRLSPVYPYEPKTIRSADHFLASSTITGRASPSRTAVSILSPFLFSLSL